MPLSTVFFSSSRPPGRDSADARIAFLLFGIGHRGPVVSFGSLGSRGAGSPGGSNTPRAKARQPLHVLQQPLRQATRRDGDMHQLVAPQSRRPARRSRTRRSTAGPAPAGAACADRPRHRRLAAISTAAAPAAQRSAHLLEAHRHLAGAPRQPQRGERTPRQQAARPARARSAGTPRRRPRRPREQVPGDGPVYHIPVRAQPHTAARQARVESGTHPALGVEHEAQQPLARPATSRVTRQRRIARRPSAIARPRQHAPALSSCSAAPRSGRCRLRSLSAPAASPARLGGRAPSPSAAACCLVAEPVGARRHDQLAGVRFGQAARRAAARPARRPPGRPDRRAT